MQDHCKQSGSPQAKAYTDRMAVKKVDGMMSEGKKEGILIAEC